MKWIIVGLCIAFAVTLTWAACIVAKCADWRMNRILAGRQLQAPIPSGFHSAPDPLSESDLAEPTRRNLIDATEPDHQLARWLSIQHVLQ